ncbi:hypothetical protein L3X38_042813 [Prunus dulcis]|uniref:Uncharacterized protein n=1 Tax=Prunus dulcis TaxID=3755 RepID=A0AAD4UXN3_PRUDU|nr:hypothetical protein L3X38_042813 [Prunus dulcis]
MVVAKKARESSAQVKGSTSAQTDGLKVDKLRSAGDVSVSNLLKTNFLSSLFACPKLVDHLRQARNLGTFSSLSLEKQNDAVTDLLQKGVSSAAEAIRSSSHVAPYIA